MPVADTTITNCAALEVLDSRGNPTLQVYIEIAESLVESACVPSGASTGTHEALELRDKAPKRYLGKGVLTAIQSIEEEIAPALIGEDALDQAGIDRILIDLDGTANKGRLGANATLGASLAVARAAASALGIELYQHLGGIRACVMPVPLLNVLNGGAHADNGLDIQEFMLAPIGFDDFAEALRAGVETYHTLKGILHKQGLATGLGDEGGFAPVLPSHEAALQLLSEAITAAGYTPGTDIALALDCAASEFYNAETKTYYWATAGKEMTVDELIATYTRWQAEYHLISIEDPFAEDDWEAWARFTTAMGSQVQVVGDDVLVTNPTRLTRGLTEGTCNAILVKPNQIGTLTETMDVIRMAQGAGWGTVISHRSGETSDTFIADLALAVNAGQIKTGAPARGERIAKYNRLLELNAGMTYAGAGPYTRYRV